MLIRCFYDKPEYRIEWLAQNMTKLDGDNVVGSVFVSAQAEFLVPLGGNEIRSVAVVQRLACGVKWDRPDVVNAGFRERIQRDLLFELILSLGKDVHEGTAGTLSDCRPGDGTNRADAVGGRDQQRITASPGFWGVGA